MGVRKYKPSDIGFPTYLDQRCQALGGCARAPGVVERIHVRLRRQQPRHGPYSLAATFASARMGLKASVSHVRGAHSFQGGIDFRQAYATSTGRRREFHGEFHLQ